MLEVKIWCLLVGVLATSHARGTLREGEGRGRLKGVGGGTWSNFAGSPGCRGGGGRISEIYRWSKGCGWLDRRVLERRFAKSENDDISPEKASKRTSGKSSSSSSPSHDFKDSLLHSVHYLQQAAEEENMKESRKTERETFPTPSASESNEFKASLDAFKQSGGQGGHLRDYFVTIYGRKPVLEGLRDPSLRIDKLLVAKGSRGNLVFDILRAADDRGIKPKRWSIEQVNKVSGNPRQDQGVALDIIHPKRFVDEWLQQLKGEVPLRPILLLDNVRNAQNIGMILRTATASGAEAVILPRKGSPGISPLVIKASAGIALRAKVLHCEDAIQAATALKAHGMRLYGLSGSKEAEDLFSNEKLFSTDDKPKQRPEPFGVWVVGNESEGISPEVGSIIDRWVKIPMEGDVESLNVANAAGIVLFELMRRRLSGKLKLE
ncbi:hypothetical protein AAMO2058_001001400 [Amorphochlora amoebiformis]